MDLEVRLGSEVRPAGIVLDSTAMQDDMKASIRTLAELAETGFFALRREISFPLEFHFTNREDWSEFLERPRAGGLEADQALLETAFSPSNEERRVVATEEVVVRAYARRSRVR